MPAPLPLDVLVGRPGGAEAVGLAPGQDWFQLARRRADWAAAFAAGPAGAPAAVHVSDSLECAAALLGAWSQGRGVILPGDDRPATAAALRAITPLGFIGDAAAPPVGTGPGPAGTWTGFPEVPVVVFTSGSTGDPVAVEKPRSCVERELEALEAAFGRDLEGASVLATVSHQHYYGLLFRLLWPLATGRAFDSRRVEVPVSGQPGGVPGPWALVTSPAFLKRLEPGSGDAADVRSAPPRPVAVFSSGGPLPWDAACRCRAVWGRPPTEVYGSSETGGVAWRRRDRESDPFLPLPGVEAAVDGDGTLRVRSPHLATPEWVRCGDLALPGPGGDGFLLRGRFDRVAKIEEKRVSLAAVERALESHPAVAEARVLVLRGVRDQLAAVVRPRGHLPGCAAERRALARDLRLHLAGRAEAAAPPRRWRFVAAMPVDPLGKTPVAALEALFAEGERLDPELLLKRPDGPGMDLDLRLPESLRWFQGHFPGLPLLPGVVQLHWAMLAAREHLGLRGDFRGLRTLKFMRPLVPGQRVTLRLSPEPGGFAFGYESEVGRHAVGRVLLG